MSDSFINSMLSPRVRSLQPSGIRKFFEMTTGRPNLISLGVGEPDFVTPEPILDVCKQALDRGRTSYTPNAGLPELREAISTYLGDSFDLDYDPSKEILVTVGSSEALDLALRALITDGDEILVPTPCYISYSPITELGGGRTVYIETHADDGFKLTPEALISHLTPRSKVLILCYPNNPTGAIMTLEELLPIAQIAEEHGLIVIADEIYAELSYAGQLSSFASLPGMKERTLLISGLSKAFAMTGWRIGYACGHPDLIAAMLKIHQYTIMCAPILGQIAANESLRRGLEDKDRMIESYDRRRRWFVRELRNIGLPCREPEGAFYVFPSIAHTGFTSEEFARRLLDEAEVVTVPGSVFGPGGEGHIRCSYASSQSNLEEALKRMERMLKQL